MHIPWRRVSEIYLPWRTEHTRYAGANNDHSRIGKVFVPHRETCVTRCHHYRWGWLCTWELTSKFKLWAAGQNITNGFPASFLRQSICTKYVRTTDHTITRVTEANNPWFMHVLCNSHHRSCDELQGITCTFFFCLELFFFLAIKEDYLEKFGRHVRLNMLTKSWNRQFKIIIHKFGRVNYEVRGSCSYRGMQHYRSE